MPSENGLEWIFAPFLNPFHSLENLRASKENMSRRTVIGPLQRVTKVTLPKLDLNDPESLAAFASPDSFDSQELDDDLLSIEEEDEGEWRDAVEVVEDDDLFETGPTVKFDDKRWTF